MMLMLWATTSWSSRAMRSRSSTTARLASSSRARSSSAARCLAAAIASWRRRVPSPSHQAAVTARQSPSRLERSPSALGRARKTSTSTASVVARPASETRRGHKAATE
jgi:hypothetical protein